MLIMSVLLNIVLAMVVIKLTMSKVTQVIKVTKDVVEVAKRGLNEVESAKKAAKKAADVFGDFDGPSIASIREAVRRPDPRRSAFDDDDIFS